MYARLILFLTVAGALTPGVWAQVAPDPALLHQAMQERREQRLQQFLLEHSDVNGIPRPDLWLKGIQDASSLSIARTIQLTPSPSKDLTPGAVQLVGVGWAQIGPAPLRIDAQQFQGQGPDSGEVTDIAIDPRGSSDRIIYISANDGGIWKSTDGGATWQPKTDSMPSLSMGAVALDPGNPSIVYAGTGNAFNNGFFKGVGVYRSTDQGETWTIPAGSSILNGKAINRIVLPAANVLLVGTGSGLFKSVDGGTSYGNNSPNFNNGQAIITGEIDDIDLDTQTAGTVYACVRGVGVRKSTDSGSTFGGSIFDANVPATFGYLTFAQSRNPDNQTMYANIDTPGDGGKIFKSTDGGTTWGELPAGSAKTAGCQCGYDQTIGVDPLDAKRVYIGFQQLFESTDGGTTFNLISCCAPSDKIHWDHHAMVFSPHVPGSAPTRVYLGTDGGVSYTENDGSTFANINEGIATCLFRGIDIGRGSTANRGYTYGGCQDTGIIEHRPAFPGADWHLAVDGDGGPAFVDPSNPSKAYSSDDGIFSSTTDGGASWTLANAAASGLPDCGGSLAGYGCAAPVGVDPNTPATVYAVSGTTLFRSLDSGATFTTIKTFPSGVVTFANVQIDSGVAWVALSDGTLQRTANLLAGAAATWTAATATGAGLPVGGIAIDPLNTAEVVVVYQGFSSVNPIFRTRHAFHTTDNGTTWTDISGTDGGDPTRNLPDLPLNSVVIDTGASPHTIIVASDAKVMRSSDLGATWQILGVGLPNVQCTSLALDFSVTPSLLRVGTYGRSAFELVPTNLPAITIPGDVSFADTCVGSTNFGTLYVCNTGNADLLVNSITSSNPQFAVITPSSGYPVVISPDFCFPFRVRFSPTSAGDKQTTFTVTSNDPLTPTKTAQGFGKGVGPTITTIIADSGSFGDVCRGDFKDLNLTINNAGGCTLTVNGISSSSSQFLVPNVVNFPIVIQPGDSTALPIRFQPTTLGAKSGLITINSNDPNTPNRITTVSGNVPPGSVRVTGSSDFGTVCAGTQAEKTISVCNVGKCNLTVTNVSFVGPCPDFVLVNNPFPAVVSHDSCLDVVIRFTPTSCGQKNCVLQIVTDDPNMPVINLPVTANTPCAAIDVPPDLGFAPEVIQSAGPCSTALPFPISNDGSCNLVITNITITGANAGDYSLSGLPSFPIILQPGHIVGEGDMNVVFAPTVVARTRTAVINVTYVSDPISGATTTVSRLLCGEGVYTGARVLVMQAGVPVPFVEQIHLQRITGNRNHPILDTQDVASNLPLVTEIPTAPCGAFQYHREYGTVSNPIQLLPGSYQVTATAIINGKRKKLSVGFDVSTCDFNSTIVVNF
jgi:hypothetical protein